MSDNEKTIDCLFKTRFSYSPVVAPVVGVTLTQQQYKEQCDIQYLLTHFGEVGEQAHILNGMLSGPRVPMFGDFSDVPDLQGTFERIRHAEESFNALPATIRARFGNNPSLLLAFVQDPANHAEAVQLGLLYDDMPKPEVISPVVGVGAVNSETLANNPDKINPDKDGK